MGEAGKVASSAIEQGKDQEGGQSGSTKRGKESPFCYIDGHLKTRMRSWKQSTKNTKVELYSEATL